MKREREKKELIHLQSCIEKDARSHTTVLSIHQPWQHSDTAEQYWFLLNAHGKNSVLRNERHCSRHIHMS